MTIPAPSTAVSLVTLLRPPNVFTAFADSLAGLVVASSLNHGALSGKWPVVLASGCLYLSGIVFNDVFDRHVDALERPTRPIPSGAVPLRSAVLLAAGLMAVGVAIPWLAGAEPGLVGLALAAAILLYDGPLKSTTFGPVVMGLCRALNMGMGLAAAMPPGHRWPALAVAGPVLLCLYTGALTYLARDEVPGNTLSRARIGLSFLAVLTVAAVIGIGVSGLGGPWVWTWVALTVLLGLRNWAPLWHGADGPSTGRAIGGGIMLIPLLDGALCAVAGMLGWALVVASLAAPAMALRRYFSPT